MSRAVTAFSFAATAREGVDSGAKAFAEERRADARIRLVVFMLVLIVYCVYSIDWKRRITRNCNRRSTATRCVGS